MMNQQHRIASRRIHRGKLVHVLLNRHHRWPHNVLLQYREESDVTVSLAYLLRGERFSPAPPFGTLLRALVTGYSNRYRN